MVPLNASLTFHRFRWAQCQIDAIRLLRDRRLKTVELVLNHMPEDLNASYERIILHLCSADLSTAVSDQILVFRILIFVAFSGRPVSIAEAAEFAVIENSVAKLYPEDRFEDSTSILSFVGSLVNVQDSILTLAHKSVKDFLESDRALYGALQLGPFLRIPNGPADARTAADIYIAQKCLSYLSLPQITARQAMTGADIKNPNLTYLGTLQQENPLLNYAASMWPYHVRQLVAQKETRHEMQLALNLNMENRPPTLWHGWLFLQQADIWERQLNLAVFLCECFTFSSLVDGWMVNFWHSRQKYRVISTSNSETVSTTEEPTRQAGDEQQYVPFRSRSRQFHDLVLLLLEIALQKRIYLEHEAKIHSLRTIDDVSSYVESLQEASRDVIPRMGEGYYDAISEILKFVMHRDVEGSDAQPLSLMQGQVIRKIFQPLRFLASSGFRQSRGMWDYRTSELKSLSAKSEARTSNRYIYRSRHSPPPASELVVRSSNHTRGPDRSPRRYSRELVPDESLTACHKCRAPFPTKGDLTAHERDSNYFCKACRICLPSQTRSDHDKTVQHNNNFKSAMRRAMWTLNL